MTPRQKILKFQNHKNYLTKDTPSFIKTILSNYPPVGTMTQVEKLPTNPSIRERKRLVRCECGYRQFKLVTYERFPDRPYLECVDCETAYLLEDELATLVDAAEWT